MRKLFFIIILSSVAASAQRITRNFNNVAMPEALRQLNRMQNRYTVNFIFNDLEDFRITTSVKGKSVPDAIRQIIGFYPIEATIVSDSIINVECSQKTALRYKGRVVDASEQPIEFANVALLSPKDSTLLAGGVTNESGYFVIPCDAKRVIARASFVGFRTVLRNSSSESLGTIRLFPDNISLKGVTVKGKKQLYIATDRGLRVDVDGTSYANFTTANEMIRHLPLMMGDGTVVGRGKPEIYINNKKVRSGDELDRLRADEILWAEIITSPGVEYGSNVMSVIRLKTKRRQGEGLSGSLALSANKRKGHYESLKPSLNYRFRNGMDIFARGAVTNYKSPIEATGNNQLVASSVWDYISSTEWVSRYRYFNTDIGWDWEINEHHSLGLTYTLFNYLRNGTGHTTQNENVFRDGALTDADSSVTTTTVKPKPVHSVNLYYVGDIGKWNVDFNADIYRTNSENEMNGSVNGEPAVSSNTKARGLLIAEKLVVAAPVPKGTLTFGEEVSNVNRTSDFRQSGFSSDNYIHQRTTMWSLFTNYSLMVGKLSFNAGLRWQNEYNHYVENHEKDNNMSPNYHVLIPKLSVGYSTNKWRHTLSYQCYRSNPSYSILTNAISYLSKYEYRTGNPYLKPNTHQRIDWSSSWKWLYINAFYGHMKNLHTTFFTAYDDAGHPGVVLQDRRDIPRSDYYGISFNVSPKIGCWQMNYSALFEIDDDDYRALGVTHVWKGLISSFNIDNTFSLPHDWMLNFFTYISPYTATGCSQTKATWSQDFYVEKKFLRDKSLSVAITTRDIFKTQWTKKTAYGGINHRTQFKEYDDNRRICIDISWKFNATHSRYKGSHAGQSERGRL